MDRSVLKRYLYGLVLLLVGSCIEPYKPPQLEAGSSFLVVDGFLNGGRGESTIQLSRTRNLDEIGKPVPELKAQVRVESERSTSYAFVEQEGGVYRLTGTELTYGEKYRIRIKTANGREYLSDFVPILKTPPIDSLTWSLARNGVQLQVNTHDPANKTRYYGWNFEETWEFTTPNYSTIDYRNGQIVPRSENIYRCWSTARSANILVGSSAQLSEDVISRQVLTTVPAEVNKLRVKYSILVRQYALSREAYEFWQNLKKNSESLGSLFDPQPSQVAGNIRCLTNPGESVLGYLSGHSIEEKRLFIEARQIPLRIASGYELCQPDTVAEGDLDDYLSGGGILIIDELRDVSGNSLGYLVDETDCVDCRERGTNVRPSFWE